MVDPDPHAEAGSKSLQKSTRALRTISEVSRELDLPQHVLRFWETRFPQIKPVKRTGGRRYYRPEDVDVLRRIQHLLHESGFTVKGARKLLMEEQARDRAVSAVIMSGTLTDETRSLLRDIRDELERLRHKLVAGLN